MLHNHISLQLCLSHPGTCASSSPLCFCGFFGHLRGDHAALNRAILSDFDTSKLLEALKALWEFCRVDLEDLGFSFHQHRSSEALLSDICTAFDKLDLANKLPTIFCEANDPI